MLFDAGLPNGQLVENLQAAGVSPADIDAIAVTHGDGDHIGGLGNFPNAQIMLPREAFRLWTEETEKMVEDFLELFREKVSAEQLEAMRQARLTYAEKLTTLKERIKQVEPGDPFLSGMRFMAAPGHRRDHFAVEINSSEKTLLHVADAFRHPIQAQHPEFYSTFDSDPKQLAATTRILMAHAAAKNALVFGAHLRFPGLARIKRKGEEFVWIDLDETSEKG